MKHLALGLLAVTVLWTVPGSLPAQTVTPTMALADAGNLPYKMQMHGTAFIGDRLYVFGGDLAGGSSATEWTKKVQSAPVDIATCKVGEWREEAPMGDMRSYMTNCVEVVNDRIYIVGGNVATKPNVELSAAPTNTISWTKVGSDGKLLPWKISPPYPGTPVMMGSTCSTDKYLLLLGGLNKEGQTAVYASTFDADGSPVNWNLVGNLPKPLYLHGSCIQNGRIYVWGGQSGKGLPSKSVYSAPFSEDGKLGAWREEQPIPESVYNASCCGINDYLVSIGGRMGKDLSNSVWFARLDQGQVTGWQKVNTNLEARVYHTLALLKDNGWVLVTGGQNKGVQSGYVVDRIQAFKIPEPSKGGAAGTIAAGYPTIDAAMATAAAQNKKVLAFFYSPAVPAAKRFWENVANTPAFKDLTKDYVLAAVDTSQKNVTWSYKLNVFRVPCLVVLSADGRAEKTSMAVSSLEDVQKFLAGSR